MTRPSTRSSCEVWAALRCSDVVYRLRSVDAIACGGQWSVAVVSTPQHVFYRHGAVACIVHVCRARCVALRSVALSGSLVLWIGQRHRCEAVELQPTRFVSTTYVFCARPILSSDATSSVHARSPASAVHIDATCAVPRAQVSAADVGAQCDKLSPYCCFLHACY